MYVYIYIVHEVSAMERIVNAGFDIEKHMAVR